MKNNPLISIVVPVYNVDQFVSKCIESILQQTLKDYELIVINDGSTDNSLSEIKKFKDKRLKIINQKNKGLSGARNAGIKEAIGKYITFIDSDDWISKNYLEVMWKYAQKYNADIVSIKECVVDSKNNYHYKNRKFRVYKQDIADALFGSFDTNYAWGKLIRREIISKYEIEFPQGRNYEDIGTMYKIYDKAKVLVVSNKGAYFYRIRKNSITNNIKESDILDQIFFLNEIKKYQFKKKYKYLDCYILYKGFTALSFLYKSNLDKEDKEKLTNSIYKSTGKFKLKFSWLFAKESLIKIILMNIGIADKCLSIKNI